MPKHVAPPPLPGGPPGALANGWVGHGDRVVWNMLYKQPFITVALCNMQLLHQCCYKMYVHVSTCRKLHGRLTCK